MEIPLGTFSSLIAGGLRLLQPIRGRDFNRRIHHENDFSFDASENFIARCFFSSFYRIGELQ